MVTGIVLAGGKSTRYSAGTKQFTIYKSKPLIFYAIQILFQQCTEIIISVHTSEQFQQVTTIIHEYFPHQTITIVQDSEQFSEFAGPVGGILTALEIAQKGYVLITPADAPFISEEMYDTLLVQLKSVDVASFIDTRGYITSLTFALNLSSTTMQHILDMYNFKQSNSLPIRATDIFLALSTSAYIRYANTVPQLTNVNIAVPVSIELHKLPDYEVIIIRNNPELIFSNYITQLLSIWKDTMIAAQLSKDYLGK